MEVDAVGCVAFKCFSVRILVSAVQFCRLTIISPDCSCVGAEDYDFVRYRDASRLLLVTGLLQMGLTLPIYYRTRPIQDLLLNELFLAFLCFLRPCPILDQLLVCSKLLLCISDEEELALVHKHYHVIPQIGPLRCLFVPLHQRLHKIIDVLPVILLLLLFVYLVYLLLASVFFLLRNIAHPKIFLAVIRLF